MTAELPERRRASDRAHDGDIVLLREDLARLVESSTQMNSKVGGLQEALQSVADLQRDQMDLRRTATETSDRVEEVAATSATRDELEEASRARRRAVRWLTLAIILGVLSFAALVTVATVAAVEFHNQQQQFKQTQYSNCLVRNSSAEASHGLLDAIIQAEQKSVDTETAKSLILALQQAEAKQAQVDCSNLLKS